MKNQFDDYEDWQKNKHRLMVHPNYHDVLFRPHCYDTLGRHCDGNIDFRRAKLEGRFPVRWVWPDEIGNLAIDLMKQSEGNLALYVKYLGMASLLSEALRHVRDEEIVECAAAAFADLAATCPDIEVNWSIGSGYTLRARGKDDETS